MDNKPNALSRMQEDQQREQIEKLQKKMNITKYNMEVSKEIMAETPSDAEQEKLAQKNVRRQHGIAGIEREMQDALSSLKD